MSTDERARRAENRVITQLETVIEELQRNFNGQLETIATVVSEQEAALSQLSENMPDGNGNFRGANVPLAPFYGNRDEDFSQYLKQFELVCRANNYDVGKWAQILASYLRDKAFYVYDSLTAAQKEDYGELTTALTEKFQTSDYRRYAHQKFQGRKQLPTETVPDYGCAVHKLGMAALATVDADQRDALIREKFISGLLPNLHELIVYSNPKNFHEAMTLAERLEGLQANKPDHSARNVMLLESIHDRLSNLEVNSSKRETNNVIPDVTYVVERPFGDQRTTPHLPNGTGNLNNFRQSYRTNGMVCFKCNRVGHLARNCPRNQNMNTVICHNCNATGHFARNCQRRGTDHRGVRWNPRINSAPSYQNGDRAANFVPNRPMHRSMAIESDEREHDDTETQQWRPLVGSVKPKYDYAGLWQILPKKTTLKETSSTQENLSKHSTVQKRKPAISLITIALFAAMLGKSVIAESSHRYKTSAPMLCQASEVKSLWKLPRSFNCPEGKHSSHEDVRKQDLELYKQNHIQYKSQAWKCVKVLEEMETFTYFFGDENLKRKKKYHVPVSSEECTTMKRFKQCGDDPMIYQGGIYQTSHKLDWYYPGGGINCCRWKKFKVTNCFMYQSYVYKRHGSTEMESAAGDVSECAYEKGQCVLKDASFLIWELNNQSACSLLSWKKVPGSGYGTSWLSDDSNLALTFTKKLQTKDCEGMPLLLSDQGIAAKPLAKGTQHRTKRQFTLSQLESFRKVVGNGGVVSSAQLAASMQALELKWRQNTNFAFSHALNSVCNFMRSIIELLRTQVLADPTNAIRSLTNQSDIFVRSGGNVIEIYPCQQLSENQYTLLPMNSSCTAQIPMNFKINNVTAWGYLDPLTNIIHRYATPIDCNLVKAVPLQMAGKTYIYHSSTGNVSLTHGIPTLKILQWNIEPVIDMKATIFHEIVIYGWSELQTHISLNDIMGGLSRQQAILRKLGISDAESNSEDAAGKAISNIMDVGYFGFLRGLSNNMFQIWTFCICVYVTTCIILIHCCPIAEIPAPFNLPKAYKTLKNRWTRCREPSEDLERVPQLRPLQLFQRFPREQSEQARLSRYPVSLDLHALPAMSLKALPSSSEHFLPLDDYNTGAESPLHDAYPRVEDAPIERELQPFRVNVLSGTDDVGVSEPSQSETIVDALLDDRIVVPTLIDTGSTRTIVSEEVAKSLHKKPSPCEWQGWSLAGLVDTVGKIDVVIEIAGQRIHGSVVVIKEGGNELILGTDFLKKLGTLSLNFTNRTMTINRTTIAMLRTAEEEQAIEHQKRAEARNMASHWKWVKNRRHTYVLRDKEEAFLVAPQWQHPNHKLTFSITVVKIDGREFQFRKADFHKLPFNTRDTIENNCKLGLAVKINNRHRNRTPDWDFAPVYNNEGGTLRIYHDKLRYLPPTPTDRNTQADDGNASPTSCPPARINALVGGNETAIDVCLEGMKVRTLVDTGSSLTIVPHNIAQMLRNPIVSGSIEAVSMTGHQLPVVGEVRTIIRIGRTDIEGNIVVTQESPYPLILGTDLLKQFGTIQMNFAKKMVTIGSEHVPMIPGTAMASVQLCQHAQIPPRSRISVMGMCYGLSPDEVRNQTPCCFSPSEKLLTKYDVVSQDSIVVPHEKLVPITVMNSDTAPKFLPEKATLGSLQVLDESEISSINMQDPSEDLVINVWPGRNDAEMRELRRQMRICADLSASDGNILRNLILKYEKLFAKNEYDLGETDLVEHSIDTGDAKPIRQRPYRTPHSLRPYLSTKIEEMLDHGIIQPSKSNWSAPVVLVKKKDTKDMRFCVDNRKLNDVTVKDNYPLKRIEDAFDMLHGSKYFATLDLQSGYWQIPVKRSDRCKTAFVTTDGLFEYTKMNFGLCNAPATFQRLMDQVLRGLDLKICMSYIDDIIIPARTVNELAERLEAVFQQLLGAGLKLKPQKCQFGMRELKFLGFVVSEHGLKADPEKIAKILNATAPKNRDELRVFLGFAGWCKRFIEGYAMVAEPLTNLLKQTKVYTWIAEAAKAFEKLKELYSSPPILAYPNMGMPFIICTDASNCAIGAVLCQHDQDKGERPISYDSRVLNKSERNYSTIEKEFLAISWAVTKKYRVYIYGHDFTVFTDHKPLLGVWKSAPDEGRLGRWCLQMQEYRANMTLEYREGKSNVVADYLSRLPQPQPTKANMVLATVQENTDLRAAQGTDDTFGPILRYLQLSELPQEKAKAQKVQNKAASYDLEDGILYKRSEKHDKLLVALPASLRETVLVANHDCLLGGHLGIRKTMSKIEKNYYWPQYYQDVVTWCRNCLACQTRKAPAKHARVPMKSVPISHINQKWAWDICGPLPLSRQGNKYILVCMEYFTKFPEIFALPDTKTERLAKIWVEHIVLRYGCPEVLISDQGANVHSALIQEICRLLDIEKLRTSAYHPQADGMVERFNRTLQHMLSMYTNEGNTDWCEFLPFVAFAYRASVHESTKESPFFLMYGYDPRLPIDTTIMPSNPLYVSTDDDYKLFVLSCLLKSRKLVSDTIERSQVKQKKQYDLATEEHTFLEGDRVLIYTPVVKKGRSKKFAKNWKGPYRIVQVSQNGTNVKVETIGRGRKDTQMWIHVNRAKRTEPQAGPWPTSVSQHNQKEPVPNHVPTENQEKQTLDQTKQGLAPTQSKEVCHKCHKRGKARWISCDQCDKWYHFRCVNLESEPSTETWNCPYCDAKDHENAPNQFASDTLSDESDASALTIEQATDGTEQRRQPAFSIILAALSLQPGYCNT